MPMDPAARATAIYDKIAMSANFGQLSSSEQAALKAQIQTIWGDGDLVYIQDNALVSTNDVGEVTSGVATGDPVVATGTGTVS